MNDFYTNLFIKTVEELYDEYKNKKDDPNDEEFYDVVVNSIPNIIENISSEVHKDLMNGLEKMYRKEDEMIVHYADRRENVWHSALLVLQAIIKISEEICIELIEDINQQENEDSKRIGGVLLKLHSRGIRLAREIIILLRFGYPDGAMARWRGLHENNIIFHLLIKN
jgi:hypothetical protein